MSKTKRFVGIREIAEELSINASTVHRLVTAGTLPAYKVGRRVLIRRDDLDNYLNQCKIATPWATPPALDG